MANQKWQVDLVLNQSSFKSQVAKAEAELNKLGQKTNLNSSISADIKQSISGFGSGLKQEIQGSGLNTALLTALGLGGLAAIFAKQISTGIADGAKSALSGLQNVLNSQINKILNSGNSKLPAGFDNTYSGLLKIVTTGKKAEQILKLLSAGRIGGFKALGASISLIPKLLGGLGKAGAGLAASQIAVNGLATAIGGTLLGPLGAMIGLFGGIPAVVGAAVIALAAAIPVMAGIQQAASNFAMPYVQAYADVQALENKLKQLGATASDVKSTFDLAKLPGLSKESAAASVSGFMAGGLTVEESQAITVALGKASGSAETLQNITRQFSQSLGKGKLQAEELNNILEQSPMIGLAMEKAFGTRNAEEFQKSGRSVQALLAGIAMELNKMPAQSSAQSSIDNLNDAVKGLKASFGEGIATGFLPFIESLTVKLDELVANGSIQKWGEQLSAVFDSGALEMTINGLMMVGNVMVFAAEQAIYLGNGFVFISQKIGEAIGFALKFVPIVGQLIGIADGISKLMGKGGIDFKMPDFLKGAAGGLIGMIGAGISGSARADRQKRLKNLEKQNSKDFGSTLKNLAGKGTKESETMGRELVDAQKQQLDYLREIANNTQPDIQRTILGGGQLGQLGITPMEIAGGARRRSSNYGPKVEKAVYDLVDLLMKGIQDGNKEAQRIGWMP